MKCLACRRSLKKAVLCSRCQRVADAASTAQARGPAVLHLKGTAYTGIRVVDQKARVRELFPTAVLASVVGLTHRSIITLERQGVLPKPTFVPKGRGFGRCKRWYSEVQILNARAAMRAVTEGGRLSLKVLLNRVFFVDRVVSTYSCKHGVKGIKGANKKPLEVRAVKYVLFVGRKTVAAAAVEPTSQMRWSGRAFFRAPQIDASLGSRCPVCEDNVAFVRGINEGDVRCETCNLVFAHLHGSTCPACGQDRSWSAGTVYCFYCRYWFNEGDDYGISYTGDNFSLDALEAAAEITLPGIVSSEEERAEIDVYMRHPYEDQVLSARIASALDLPYRLSGRLPSMPETEEECEPDEALGRPPDD